MLEAKTICDKVDRCLELIEEAFKTKNLDAPALASYLHQIRSDAQHMENALRRRKEVMHEAGIEKDYQKEKGKQETPPGINRIGNIPQRYISTQPKFQMTVKSDGKIVYQNDSFAGVLAAVESFEDIDNAGEIRGQSQQFYYGHPLLMFYAFQQVERGMEDHKVAVMSAWYNAMKDRKDVDPSIKDVLRKMAGNDVPKNTFKMRVYEK